MYNNEVDNFQHAHGPWPMAHGHLFPPLDNFQLNKFQHLRGHLFLPLVVPTNPQHLLRPGLLRSGLWGRKNLIRTPQVLSVVRYQKPNQIACGSTNGSTLLLNAAITEFKLHAFSLVQTTLGFCKPCKSCVSHVF